MKKPFRLRNGFFLVYVEQKGYYRVTLNCFSFNIGVNFFKYD